MRIDLGIDDMGRHDRRQDHIAQPTIRRGVFLHDFFEIALIDGDLVMRVGFDRAMRSEEQTSELQSLMIISYAVFCLKKKQKKSRYKPHTKLLTTHKWITNSQKHTEIPQEIYTHKT